MQVSIGTLWTQQLHYKQLDVIHLQVLGGQAFGVEAVGEGNEVKCFLITDDTAKQLLNNAYLEIFESEEFCIEPPSAVFQKKDTRGLRAKFDDM
ncbi:unnamed protein product, partial [Cylicostephanus goldi]